jgi:sporulation protein YabP
VEDVTGFDETLIVLKTGQGDLNVHGQELHIERIDLEAGVLEVRGHIQELSYEEPARSGGLWARLFG